MQTNNINEYDVVITGGGIAGISAAVKASQMGVKALLIEQYGFLGGMSTAGMVSPFMKHSVNGQALVNGVYKSIEQEMLEMKGMINNGFYASAFRLSVNKLLKKYGCHILLNCELMSVNRSNEEIESVEVFTDGKKIKIKGKVFIDTTGDAQLLYLGKLPWQKGSETTGKLQALTMFFRMANINMKKVADYVIMNKDNFFNWMDYEFNIEKIISVAGYFKQVKKAITEGRLSPEVEYIFFTTLPEHGEASFNTTNILELDGSSSYDLTKAEIKGRNQVAQVVKLLQEEIPGFEKAFLLETAAQVGVRETRRAVGDYVYTGEDIRKGKKFEDAIARGCYGIDIHGQIDEDSVMEHLREGEYYEVPLRALFVSEIKNVLAAGRCISSTREGHSALRIMPTSAATGEACGAAAAMAVKLGKDLRELLVKEVQRSISYNISEIEHS
ncbi:MAG: FAD-dependent oxidoreductase [Bacteroidota bacterium]|nr:FAD-dependent oxidoreductase [Bacteroidota bacterium]